MIRPAKTDDVPRIVELGRLLHAASSYATQRFDEDKVADTMRALIGGSGVVFVAEIDGVVVGGIAGAVTEPWFSREKIAFDYSFFIDPARRHGVMAVRLLKTFFDWARRMGAERIHMGITTGVNVEETARLYRALGMKDAGALFERQMTDDRGQKTEL
ncbi:MAG: GNAT family N-acetyltransferase [Candidatus Accumulibacter sp.]|nr:GNAT family N-acetyltransferase [Accumulibacter sp.]